MDGENGACGMLMGREERPEGASPFGTRLIQGDPNFQSHEMGTQLSQRLPRLLAGTEMPSLAARLPSCPGRHRMPGCKKEQLMLSEAATKSPTGTEVSCRIAMS